MDKYVAAMLIGMICYIAAVMISFIIITGTTAQKPKPEPRVETDGTVLYYPEIPRIRILCSGYLFAVALFGIAIAEYILKSSVYGTMFTALGGVVLCIAVFSHVVSLRSYIKLTEDKIICRGTVKAEIKFCDIGFYNVAGGLLTMYDKYGVPIARAQARLVGFELLVHALNEHDAVIVENPFPTKHCKSSLQYKAYKNNRVWQSIGGFFLACGIIALALFSFAFGLSLPPATIEPIATVTGKIDDLNAGDYKVWMEGDGNWFVINSVDRPALDESFWDDVRKGDEIELTYYICVDIGGRRDIGNLVYDGKTYLDLEDVKRLEAEERGSMLFASAIVYPVSAAATVMGIAIMSVANLVYKSKRKKLYEGVKNDGKEKM